MSSFTQERICIGVTCVGRARVIAQILTFAVSMTLERNPLNVRCVIKALIRHHNFKPIRATPPPPEKKTYKWEACNSLVNQNPSPHQRLSTGEKPYKCEVCGKDFSKASNLQVHQRIHTGEKTYKYGMCDKNFSLNSHLQAHQRVHTGERPYKCDTCGKYSTQISHLQVHQRVHTGEKPYKCETCGKGFCQSSHLQAHRRVHTGEKPYKCEECGKGFIWNSYLHVRQRITQERNRINVACVVRPHIFKPIGELEDFNQTSHLQAHWRVHTGDKPYKCFDCGNDFSKSSRLQVR
ncbi:zinc finger protein 233 [Felis catus]|uniref:zinc finger protein 233 n=1 Tax=Felis catus TaxID=9685 RepID=UPI001D1A1A75|nr:zinc finger protein 233 [Felis catus]XP_044901658.1 zinc finger protein 233 [Felis catus]